MIRWVLFLLAVATVYVGGFAYDEVGPLVYALTLALLASTPLMLKLSFWKKILLMLPLLVLRVLGKILLKVFGINAFSRILQRYGLLEQRFQLLVQRIGQTRSSLWDRWRRMDRALQAYLVLIFLPVALVVMLATLVIRIVRLKFLQMLIEKCMQFGIEKASHRYRKKPESERERD